MRKMVAVLNREQIRKTCRNMETEGNFGREQGPPSSGDLQCSAPILLKGNLYISASAGLGNEGFPSEIKNHHARFSTKNYEVPEKPVSTVESLYLVRSQGLAQSLLQQLFFSLSP